MHLWGGCRDFQANLTSGAEGNVFDGSEAWAYIDGTCEIPLPPGRIFVVIRKGFEYSPLNATMELLPGKLAMRFQLERWTDGASAAGMPAMAAFTAALLMSSCCKRPAKTWPLSIC